MPKDDVFFPQLVRLSHYPRNRKGEYYADYNKYREHIRKDCKGRCVYCDCHENENGGAENMNLDHFRPKSLARFAHLVNDPVNLMWSCGGCNRFKGDHWPDENSDSSIIGDVGFIDPFEANYKDYFQVEDTGALIPKKAPAKYMLILLALNRPSKQSIRKMRLIKLQLVNEIQKLLERISEYQADPSKAEKLAEDKELLAGIQRKLIALLDFEF